MKIVGVISSLSPDKNTAKLVYKALEGAQSQEAEIEDIFLPDYKLEYCKGCMTCLKLGQCSINDDLELIRKKLYEADGIIIGSPTHGLAPNAMMKNLLDRIGLYSVYTASLSGKYIVGISTAGAMGAKKTAKQLTNIGGSFFGRSYISGILSAAIGWDTIDQYPDYLDRAYYLGIKIVDDIKNQKKYPFQNLFSRILNNLIVKKVIIKNITSHKDEMSAVYEHNVLKGWLK